MIEIEHLAEVIKQSIIKQCAAFDMQEIDLDIDKWYKFTVNVRHTGFGSFDISNPEIELLKPFKGMNASKE